mgnify:CR=1 FL=1
MATKNADVAIRYWLTFSSKDIQRPLLWEMSHTFDVIYDIRSASVGPDIGLVGLELSGQAKVIESALPSDEGVSIGASESDVIKSDTELRERVVGSRYNLTAE